MPICNACSIEIEDKGVVTACKHLFCLKCAQTVVENDSNCPVCDAAITKRTVKVVRFDQDPAELQLQLCGRPPETAFSTALASVQFHMTQQQFQADLREAQMSRKITKVQDACRKKLEEVHNGYIQAKRKYEEAMRSNQQLQQTIQQLQQDSQELQAKYAQKAMQARKLQEAYKKLQHESEMQRLSGPKGPPLSSAGMGVRSTSPMAPEGHTVTMVQRTKVFGDLSSPPNSLLGFGNAGQQQQQQTLPTSGRVQGITGGYRAGQGGHTGMGSGGGFLGGSLDPNSPVGILTGGPQGLRRAGSSNSGGGGGGGGHIGAGMLLGGGQASQNSQALRQMLGMQPALPGMGAVRNNGNLRSDLFSM